MLTCSKIKGECARVCEDRCVLTKTYIPKACVTWREKGYMGVRVRYIPWIVSRHWGSLFGGLAAAKQSSSRTSTWQNVLPATYSARAHTHTDTDTHTHTHTHTHKHREMYVSWCELWRVCSRAEVAVICLVQCGFGQRTTLKAHNHYASLGSALHAALDCCPCCSCEWDSTPSLDTAVPASVYTHTHKHTHTHTHTHTQHSLSHTHTHTHTQTYTLTHIDTLIDTHKNWKWSKN